jgi:hypothetical protein
MPKVKFCERVGASIIAAWRRRRGNGEASMVIFQLLQKPLAFRAPALLL